MVPENFAVVIIPREREQEMGGHRRATDVAAHRGLGRLRGLGAR
jgi:hypothetical protein